MSRAREQAERVRRRKRERWLRQAIPRAKTINVSRISKCDIESGRRAYPEAILRPKRRAACEQGLRPCPYVGCRYNLYLDVDLANGSIKLNFPHLEPHEMTESCALDVAARGELAFEDVGELMNLTRERVRQIEQRAQRRMRRRLAIYGQDLDR